ncbi:UvrABC system protein A [Acrasis kona]|uniref:UvrABC system protein A n=1 Tax=Acrasis kona TaxID=1008807 RepID=A0AAW2YL76_9EUKA
MSNRSEPKSKRLKLEPNANKQREEEEDSNESDEEYEDPLDEKNEEKNEQKSRKRPYTKQGTGYNNRLNIVTPLGDKVDESVFRHTKKTKQNTKSLLVLKSDKYRFDCEIPHHVETKQSQKIEGLLEVDDLANKNTLLLFDYPGVGKTQTIIKAAEKLKIIYIQIPCETSNVVTSLINALNGTLEPKEYCKEAKSDFDIMTHVKFYASILIVTVMEEALAYFKNNQNSTKFTSTENRLSDTLNLYPNQNKADERFVDLKRELLSLVKGSSGIIIHLDEVHYFPRAPEFKRPSRDERGSAMYTQDTEKAILTSYILIGLSHKLYTILDAQVKVVISGTNTTIKNSIIVDSEVKPFIETLRYSTIQDICKICDNYLNINTEDENVRGILSVLCGPFRRTQHFLNYIFYHYRDHYIGGVQQPAFTLDSLRQAVMGSYTRFKSEVHSKLDHDEMAMYANDMMLCAVYPQIFLGRSGYFDFDSSSFTKLDQLSTNKPNAVEFDDVPNAWISIQDKSIARWVKAGVKFYLIKPYPQLHMFYNEMCHEYFKSEDKYLQVLQNKLVAQVGNTGAHGFTFQYAIAYELSNPLSPLWKNFYYIYKRKFMVRVGVMYN